MYKVIKYFTDLQDRNHAYSVGDVYPREGVTPKEERVVLLASNENLQGEALIEFVKEAEAPENEEAKDEKEAGVAQEPPKSRSARKTQK